MSAERTSLWFTFPLRVNGVAFYKTSLRSCGENPDYFEVLVRDGQLGTFSLHGEFILEICEDEWEEARWRQVSLRELRAAISKAAEGAACHAKAGPDAAEEPREAPEGSILGTFGRIPVEGDSSHVGRAEQALTRAGVRFQIVGGLDGRGHGACHLTLVVPALVGARASLRRAGFLESPESKYVLVDSRTGWKLRLLQGRPETDPSEARRQRVHQHAKARPSISGK